MCCCREKIRPIPLYTYLIEGLAISEDGSECYSVGQSLQSVGQGPAYTASFSPPFESGSYSGIKIAVYEGPIETGRLLSEAYSVSDSLDSTSITICEIGLFTEQPDNWLSACPAPTPPDWCGLSIPDTLRITATGWGDGPCRPNGFGGGSSTEITNGVNGVFDALTITPTLDGYTADFGVIGTLVTSFYDVDDCTGSVTPELESEVTLTLDYNTTTGEYALTWTATETEGGVMAHSSGTCPEASPAITNDSPTRPESGFSYSWETGTIVISQPT